jgi:hypothetical protein
MQNMAAEKFYIISSQIQARNTVSYMKGGSANIWDFKALRIYFKSHPEEYELMETSAQEIEEQFAALRSDAIQWAMDFRDRMKDGKGRTDTETEFRELMGDFRIQLAEIGETDESMREILKSHWKKLGGNMITSLEDGSDQLYARETILMECLAKAGMALETFLEGRNTTLACWNSFLVMRYRGELRRLRKEACKHAYAGKDGPIKEVLQKTENRSKYLEALVNGKK